MLEKLTFGSFNSRHAMTCISGYKCIEFKTPISYFEDIIQHEKEK